MSRIVVALAKTTYAPVVVDRAVTLAQLHAAMITSSTQRRLVLPDLTRAAQDALHSPVHSRPIRSSANG